MISKPFANIVRSNFFATVKSWMLVPPQLEHRLNFLFKFLLQHEHENSFLITLFASTFEDMSSFFNEYKQKILKYVSEFITVITACFVNKVIYIPLVSFSSGGYRQQFQTVSNAFGVHKPQLYRSRIASYVTHSSCVIQIYFEKPKQIILFSVQALWKTSDRYHSKLRGDFRIRF